MNNVYRFLLLLLMVIITMPAFAYVGPGMGAGAIAVIVGILGSILLALFAIIYYPIKRGLKKIKTNKPPDCENEEIDDTNVTGKNRKRKSSS